MNAPRKFTHLGVVDNVLSNFRMAGFEPDEETIAFVWKIARNEVSREEISKWTQELRSRINENRKGAYSEHLLKSGPAQHDPVPIVARAASELHYLKQRIEQLLGQAGNG